MTTVFPDPRRHDVESRRAEMESHQRDLHAAIDLLGAAATAVRLPVSPQMAAGVQATENAWRLMGQEFGLYTGPQVAELSGSAQKRGGYANDKRRAGRLLGIRRANAYLYPGFQFEATGRIRDVIPQAIATARELGVDENSLAQWFCVPSATLEGRRPVDFIEDPEKVLSVLRTRFGVQW